MIKISITSGEWQGREWYFVGSRVVENFAQRLLGEEIDPPALLNGLAKQGDTWEIDYSQAMPDETTLWLSHDIVARVLRALEDGRFVRFMGREWRWRAEGASLPVLVGEIEDAIVNSGFNVCLEADDENGVVIGTVGLE